MAGSVDDSVNSYRALGSLGSEIDAEFSKDERGEWFLVLNDAGVSVEVTVIPNGYDWEESIVFTVHS